MTKTEHEAMAAAGMASWAAAFDYTVDAWQRGILFLDVLRQRGNQYLEHMAKQAPHVLQFVNHRARQCGVAPALRIERQEDHRPERAVRHRPGNRFVHPHGNGATQSGLDRQLAHHRIAAGAR